MHHKACAANVQKAESKRFQADDLAVRCQSLTIVDCMLQSADYKSTCYLQVC